MAVFLLCNFRCDFCREMGNAVPMKFFFFGFVMAISMAFTFSSSKREVFIEKEKYAFMQFDSLVKDAGTVTEGAIIRKNYYFTNTGNDTLVITSIMSSDGGGGWNYKGAYYVPPGEKGIIELYQSTTARISLIDKVTTIQSNHRDGTILLHIKANIIPPCPEGVNFTDITFDSDTFNFGTVNQCEYVKHDFQFTNTGKTDLIIKDVRTNTGATTVEWWPKTPIPPGGKGTIRFTFNTIYKVGSQSKLAYVESNACPQTIILRVNGFVNAPK
jgi:hypothetical protein